jgi:2-polyprenyl-6-methoxyphenol hydroxylase-like FAD-dependent oxidoreductase
VKDQRAASIQPPTLELLDDLGITKKIIPRGLVSEREGKAGNEPSVGRAA